MSGEKWQDAQVTVDAGSLASWTGFVQDDGKLLCTGKCPRCSDEASVEVLGHSYGVTAAAEADEGQRFNATAPMGCNCPGEHPGRPDGYANGCGAVWFARPLRHDDGSFTLDPVDDLRLEQAARTVYEASQKAEDGITAAAGKWIPGVSAVTSLFGLSSIAFSRDAAGQLSAGWRISAYILVVLATMLAASATVLVYRAAFGWPERFPLDSDEHVLAAARKIQSRAETAARRLKQSLGLAGAGLAVLLAAIGVLWLSHG